MLELFMLILFIGFVIANIFALVVGVKALIDWINMWIMETEGIYIDYLEVEKEVKYLAFTYNILSVDSFMEDVLSILERNETDVQNNRRET